MKKLILAVSAIFMLGTSSAFAGANSNTGCGLGSMIISRPNSAFLYAIQASTNHTIFLNQTFGITSGTSNCRKSRLVMNERTQEFIAANMDTLSKEIARGHGESVDTLAELMNIEDKATFAKNLQYNYNKIYASKDTVMADVADNVATM